MSIADIQQFFFEAMVEGWVADAEESKVLGMPGYRIINFARDELVLTDLFCVTPGSSKSAGTTTIWHKEVPVWVMQYGGWYMEGVIPFLKHALLETYKAKRFVGGRGRSQYCEGQLLYVNRPHVNDFSDFNGHEQVFMNDKPMGVHHYRGMMMLG